MDFKKLVEAGRKAQTAAVSDSVIRRKRILDAKRRMAARREKRDEDAPRVNRIGDSARATRTPMRGMAAKRVSAMQGLRRKQDSAAKTYFALRKRIKDELAETESTDEAIDTAIEIMQNEVDVNPADVLAAVVEVISEVADTLPSGDAPAEEDVDAPAEEDDYDVDEDEVADSFSPRRIVRRRAADSARRAAIRRRVLDAMEKRRAAARRVRDARIRRASIARRADSTDALKRRVAARRAMARRADSVNKRIVRR